MINTYSILKMLYEISTINANETKLKIPIKLFYSEI